MSANRKRLTETSVLSLPVKRAAYRVWDAGTDAARGLHVLVQPTGTRTFRVMWRYPGSSMDRNTKLGRVGDMTLDEARIRAREVRRKAVNGEDPKQSDPANSTLFKSCVETWTSAQKNGKGRVSADKTCKWVLTRTKVWHDRPIATIKAPEIERLLHDVRDGTKGTKPAPYASLRLFAHLRAVFRWRLKAATPMADMEQPWHGAKRRTRDWFKGTKADDAIRELWRFADQIGGNHGGFIKLLIVTGKRRSIVQTMRWDDIDVWFWTPPPGTKNKRNHAIPLPKLAQRILGDLTLCTDKPRTGRVLKPIEEQLLSAKVKATTGIDTFFWHGIRHVIETKLAELRVPPHLRDQLLDHASERGAGKGYDHWEYRDEMLEALELWCAHIESLIAEPQWQANLRRRVQRQAENVA
jgi:integrase